MKKKHNRGRPGSGVGQGNSEGQEAYKTMEMTVLK